jgi:replicative superfamily II helicase
MKVYSWQRECVEQLKGNRSRCLVTAPSASGKTIVAYVWAGLFNLTPEGEVEKNGNLKSRVIFTAPIKALSNERYRELKKAGFSVGIITGDVKRDDDAPILCMTQEIYTQSYCHHPGQKIIIDEAHYMFWDSKRFRAYADGMYRCHLESDMLLLSATLSDHAAGLLEKVCGKLNRYDYQGINTYEYLFKPQNPVELLDVGKEMIIFLFSYRGVNEVADYIAEQTQACQTQGELQELIRLAKQYRVSFEKFSKLTTYKVGIYHGDLLLKEKLYFEELFRRRLISCMVATDGLALGVNLPAQYVLFGQLAKYYEGRAIGKSNFLQMAGRAGRPGYHNSGFAGFCYTGFEAFEFDTEELFSELVDSELEEPAVPLEIDVRSLLSQRVTIRDEFEFLHRLDESISYETVLTRWEQTQYALRAEIGRYAEDEAQEEKIFQQLCKAYSQELEVGENVYFAYWIAIQGFIDAGDIVLKYRNVSAQGKTMHQLLQYLKYLRRQGDAVINLYLLEGLINQIDTHYLMP